MDETFSQDIRLRPKQLAFVNGARWVISCMKQGVKETKFVSREKMDALIAVIESTVNDAVDRRIKEQEPGPDALESLVKSEIKKLGGKDA